MIITNEFVDFHFAHKIKGHFDFFGVFSVEKVFKTSILDQ